MAHLTIPAFIGATLLFGVGCYKLIVFLLTAETMTVDFIYLIYLSALGYIYYRDFNILRGVYQDVIAED